MSVSLISYSIPTFSETPADTVFLGLSQCYNSSFTKEDVLATKETKKNKIISSVLESGHTSVAEHVSFTFLIEGITITACQQLTRHRIASYSQRSFRYTELEGADWYFVPSSISKDKEALEIYIEAIEHSKKAYNKLKLRNIPQEDARGVLPVFTKTNIVVTMNARALKNFFAERLCTRAQKEIRDVAKAMAVLCKKTCPEIFELAKFAEPKCVQNYGICYEQKCCGKSISVKNLVDNI